MVSDIIEIEDEEEEMYEISQRWDGVGESTESDECEEDDDGENMFENLEGEDDVSVNPEVVADTCSCTAGNCTQLATHFRCGP